MYNCVRPWCAHVWSGCSVFRAPAEGVRIEMEDLQQLVSQAIDAVGVAADEAALDEVRVAYLGKKGRITALSKSLGKLDPSERPAAGARSNSASRRSFWSG